MTGFGFDVADGAIAPAPPRGPFVVRLLASAQHGDLGPSCFLMSWDVEAHDGRGTCRSTFDLDEAHQFATAGEALATWRAVPESRPLRDDGKPNRPLSGFTIEVLTIDQARQETCGICHGEGRVCEDHPDRQWQDGGGCCGAAGMACACQGVSR